MGEKRGIANSLSGLGMDAFLEDDFVAARSLHSESLAIRNEIGDPEGAAVALINLGAVATQLADYPGGRDYLHHALVIIRDQGDRRLGAFSIEAIASIEDHEGNKERATILHGAAQTIREEIGSPQPANELAEYEKTLGALESHLGTDAFNQRLQTGRQMSFEAATEFALAPAQIYSK